MLSLWNPLVPEKVKSDNKMSSRNYLNRLLSDPFETIFNDTFHTPAWGVEYYKKEDNSLAISIDVPGITEENINIEISTDNILTVKGERKSNNSSYSVQKSLTLPEGYDRDNIRAELKNGVLTLTLVSKPTSQKEVKRIEITSSK